MTEIKSLKNFLIEEFKNHLPYTTVGSLLSLLVMWFVANHWLMAYGPELTHEKAEMLFHLFHPAHILLSAIATTALFRHHNKSILKTVGVGTVGTLIPCGLSDYFFPLIGGLLFKQEMHLHVCVVNEPLLVFSFLFIGILAGFWANDFFSGSWLLSHGAHVFVSSSASLLYLLSFGFDHWVNNPMYLFPVFSIMVLAVWIPCCLSDIVVPVASTCHSHGCTTSNEA